MDPHYIDSNSKNSKENSESKGSGERGSNAPRRSVVPVRVPRAHMAGLWNLQICPTTGGKLDLMIPCTETVEGLKKAIAKSLRIPKERINLLHKDRLMKEGPLLAYGVCDGSKVTLLPNVETGLVSQKPDHSVMQALENLSEGQVNDFLGGKCPLTLAMRLGEHMMFVQLQLSTSGGVKRAHASPSHHHTSSKRRRQHAGASSSTSASSSSTSAYQHHRHHHHTGRPGGSSSSSASSTATGPSPSSSSSTSSSSNSARREAPTPTYPSLSLTCTHPAAAHTMQATLGLGRRAACPATTTATYSVRPRETGSTSPVPGRVSPGNGRQMLPNKLAGTSTCLGNPRCQCSASASSKRVPSSPAAAASSSSQTSTTFTPRASPSVCPLPPTSSQLRASPLPVPAAMPAPAPTPTPQTHPSSAPVPERLLVPPPTRAGTPSTSSSSSSSRTSTSSSAGSSQGEKAAASSASSDSKSSQQGAIIETMQHLGHGVYSGTFSGTLNPALQDQAGNPRRSINTIVHILNDLLGATPEYAAYYASRIPHASQHGHGGPAHRQYRGSHASRHAKKVNHERVQENRALKGKVQQIQQMLQEKRERRRARRAARTGPYPWTNPQPSDCEASNEPLDSDQSMDVTAVDVSQGDVDSANFTEQIKAENNTGDAELKHTGTIVA